MTKILILQSFEIFLKLFGTPKKGKESRLEDSNFDDKISTIYHRLDFWAATAVFDREEDQRETKHLCLNIKRRDRRR